MLEQTYYKSKANMSEKPTDAVPESMEVDESEKALKDVLSGVEPVSDEYAKALEQLKRTQPRLPISKVKKIAKCDPEYILTAGNAFVAAAFATELFVQSLTEEMIQLSYLSSKSANSKSVRLAYQHLSDCVARKENYQFLEDVVPKTKNLRTLVKENKVRYITRPEGQQTLPFQEKVEKPDVGDVEDDDVEDDDDDDQDSQESEVEDPAVEEQLKEIEEMNRVPDLPDDEHRSDEEHSDHSDHEEPPAN